MLFAVSLKHAPLFISQSKIWFGYGKKTTDILMIGNCECQAYSNGTYGTKVKKAIEYNEKGCHIKIIQESDFFSSIK